MPAGTAVKREPHKRTIWTHYDPQRVRTALGTQELLTIPASWRGAIDSHKPLSERGQPLDLAFHHVHRLLGQFDAGLIGGRHQGDHGMVSFPSHGAGILDYCLH